MVINHLSVGFKFFFNWILIFGKFGMPALGAVGAGLSTAIVGWMTLLAGLWAIRHDPYYLRFTPAVGRPHWPSQKELLRLGIPMGGSYSIEVCDSHLMDLPLATEGMFRPRRQTRH